MVLLLHARQAENQAKIATESGAPAWGGKELLGDESRYLMSASVLEMERAHPGPFVRTLITIHTCLRSRVTPPALTRKKPDKQGSITTRASRLPMTTSSKKLAKLASINFEHEQTHLNLATGISTLNCDTACTV